MSRIARVTAGALLAATALAVAPAPASAEFPPECTVSWHGKYPVVTCTL